MLKLLHPFMPFITEEIWQALPHEGEYLMLQKWPEYRAELSFPEEEGAMELVMEAISAVRTRRAEMNVPPSKKARLTVVTDQTAVFELGIPFLKRLAYADAVEIVTEAPSDAGAMVSAVTHEARMFMPMSDLVDMEKEKARMEKELGKNKAELEKLETKLQNPGFINKAPANVVAAEQERAEKLKSLIAKLEEQLSVLA